MQVGSEMFEVYNRTLRRMMWANFIDEQMRVAMEHQYKAAIVADKAHAASPGIAHSVHQSRNRGNNGS